MVTYEIQERKQGREVVYKREEMEEEVHERDEYKCRPIYQHGGQRERQKEQATQRA